MFLHEGKAQDRGTHWVGPADFLVEIISSGDETRGKIPFYQRLGVRELLIVDRDPWKLEVYRHDGRSLRPIGETAMEAPPVCSEIVPVCFRLIQGEQRPGVEVSHAATGRKWRL